MVFFVVRGFSLVAIAAMTGLLWAQDHTKKIVVVKNTTQAIFRKDDQSQKVISVTDSQPVSQQKKGIIQKFNEASEAKKQKLSEKHLFFGALSLFGALLMPKLFLLIAIGYFAAYQLYYFALDNQQFTPLWNVFMLAGAGLIGGKFLKFIN